MTITLIAAVVLLLAWANGANDVSKGIASLVGGGVTQARRALWWGTLWTVMGGLTAVVLGAAMVHTFSSGLLRPETHLSLGFLLAALCGAVVWVLGATRFGLPVSTTHALLGGLVGATLAATGPQGLLARSLLGKIALPLLVSPLVAILLCSGVLWLAHRLVRQVPIRRADCCSEAEWRADPFLCATPASRPTPPRVRRRWAALHWMSAAAISFARALNDVPKIAAVLIMGLALSPGAPPGLPMAGAAGAIIAVTVAMGLGGLWGGRTVLHVLAHRVAPLDAYTGLVANLCTSSLVLLASPLGLPVSTTHVSTGALLGVRWNTGQQPAGGDALKGVLYGWLVTFPVAGLISAGAVALSRLT
ncbi:inorganic phosphate transporter [Cupriavidus sp. IK-TO18]|uniref:inorganic phosphate transporter n=1 Tax=Cupriavidus sp. IK-TO18 TaxID=2782182 RepID=UPI001896E80E|nr:inorganic phosphate transporter [Cupriavidus sp. IK-TO18]MBF6989456.1 inorganic phosphate transporter [Cupriavidus sp. IK-TO18]